MTAEAEILQIRALSKVLPVRVKLLDTAGTQPYVANFEPGVPLSSPTTSTQAQTAASAADGAAEEPQQVWIRYRLGHYEVVYPAEGFENHHGAA